MDLVVVLLTNILSVGGYLDAEDLMSPGVAGVCYYYLTVIPPPPLHPPVKSDQRSFACSRYMSNFAAFSYYKR